MSTRQTAASVAVLLALGATACSGGDATPTDPAEEAPAGNGELGPGPAGQGVEEPAPDRGISDPGDDLEEPEPGS